MKYIITNALPVLQQQSRVSQTDIMLDIAA